MATRYQNTDNVATQVGQSQLAATADNTSDRIVESREVRGAMRVYHSEHDGTNVLVHTNPDVLRLAKIPFGARILGGVIGTEDSYSAGAMTAKVGIIGVSGTDYDDDDDAFVVTGTSITNAAGIRLEWQAAARIGDLAQIGYTVTDPKGAYVILTSEAASSASGKTLVSDVYYVTD